MCSYSLTYREHAVSVLSSLSDMRNARELCDVVLNVETRQIFAHRSVLAANSPYFKAMFTSGLTECRRGHVQLKEVDETAVEALVDFMYTSHLDLSRDNVYALLVAADRFQLLEAKFICMEFLKQRLTVLSCLEVAEFADCHCCAELENAALFFARSHFAEVARSEEFLHVTYGHLLKLLSSDYLKIQGEEQVFEAVARWVNYDMSSRRQHFCSLLSNVRLPFVSAAFLTERIAPDRLVQEDSTCQGLVEEAFVYLLCPRQRPMLAHSSPRAKPRRISSVHEMVIAAGGQCVDGTMQSAEQYNPKCDEWQQIPDLNCDRYGFALVTCDYKQYAFGGCSSLSGFQTSVEAFDAQKGQWETLMEMKPRRYFGAVEACGVVYVAGGHDGITVLPTLECFNPSAIDEWTILTSMVTPRLYPGLVGIGGCLFAIGGHCGKARLDSVECYNIEKDQWQFVAPLPAPSSVVAAVGAGGCVYTIGGYNGQSHLSTVHIYDPDHNEWVVGPSLPYPRSAAAAIECEGCLYICGGFNNGSFLNSVERLDPRTPDWCHVASMNSPRAHFAVTALY